MPVAHWLCYFLPASQLLPFLVSLLSWCFVILMLTPCDAGELQGRIMELEAKIAAGSNRCVSHPYFNH